MKFHPAPFAAPSIIPAVLRCKDAAAYVGVSRSTIQRLRCTGDFPKPVLVGPQTHAWRVVDLDAWLASRVGAEPESR